MARKQKKYHYIYKTTCNITGRYYIGMHSTDKLNDNYIGSGKRLWFSLNYHGRDNHVKEILEFLPDRKSLKDRERGIVNEELLGDKMCMNLKLGGEGGFVNEEHMMKCQKAGNEAMSEKFKNDVEYYEKHKKLFIKNLKKSHEEGKIPYGVFKNKKHTEETKLKMSKSSKGMGIGKANSQYGTCWITKDGINKKIKKEDLGSYLKEGWVKGRK